MYRLGINIPDYGIEQYRLNYSMNKDLNVLHDGRKALKTEQPRPDRFFTPIPDNRDAQLAEMRKEMEKKLVIDVPERRM